MNRNKEFTSDLMGWYKWTILPLNIDALLIQSYDVSLHSPNRTGVVIVTENNPAQSIHVTRSTRPPKL
jgi:hypothetical protein